MDNEESLYSVFKELNELNKKLAIIEEKKRLMRRQEFISKIDKKIECFSKLIKCITDHQEQINSKLGTLALKIPEKSVNVSDNSLQLSHTHHTDFINLLSSKHKLEKLVQDREMDEDKSSDFIYILNELKTINSTYYNQLFEQSSKYKSSKGLLDNIIELNSTKNNCQDDELFGHDDLGCFPNDCTAEENSKALHDFATSSPLVLYKQKK